VGVCCLFARVFFDVVSWSVAHGLCFVCRISTPRRFGKTISVCLFVAALVFACPMVEISIYSTCK